MPELPEVAIARTNLDRWTKGREVLNIEDLGATHHGELHTLRRHRFLSWTRRGKYLSARLDGDIALLSHLGMTGKWVRDAGSRPYQRLRITFAPDGSRDPSELPGSISLVDRRKLGITWLLEQSRLDTHPRLARLGPDAFNLASAVLKARCGQGSVALKTRLMDQGRVAGLGNICAIESCFRARVHPHVPAGSLDDAQWPALSAAIDAHIAAVIEHESGDEITYLGERAGAGEQNVARFLIYGRAGQACPVCGTTIASARLAGRPTTFCPSCQPHAAAAGVIP